MLNVFLNYFHELETQFKVFNVNNCFFAFILEVL